MSSVFSSLQSLISYLSEKLGFDLRLVLKGGSWIGVRFFILAISGWIVSISFARIGTKALLGQYQFILATLSMISVISLPGLNTAALEAVVKKRDKAVLKAVRLSFYFSLFTIPVIVGFGAYHYFLRGDHAIAFALFSISLLAPLLYAFNTWTVFYDGKSLFRDTSIRIIILNILLALGLVTGLFFHVHLPSLVMIYVSINVVVTGYYFLEIRRRANDSSDDFDFRFGVNVSVQKFVLGLSSNIPPLAIAYYFGSEAVAIFYIAYYLISAMFAFLGNMTYLYLPKLFRGDSLKHHNSIFQNLIVGIFSWVAYLCFLHFFFIHLYGEEYRKSLEIGYQISAVLFFIPLKTYLITYFMTQRKNFLLIAVALIANIVGLLILYLFRNEGFSCAVVWYTYAVEIFTTVPLLFTYWQKHLKTSNV